MSDRTQPAGGIFLSYAREDKDAARRIAEALRTVGLEVWFDENELRGGDAWDAQIRQKIRECALFIPIISAQTQARAEGYFRREWKLADNRTEDMGRRQAFLIPVCIDDTDGDEADVPDSFLRVQWTRLPGALPTPDFVAQVKRLLEAPKKPSLKPDLPRPPDMTPEFQQAARAQVAPPAAARGKPAVPAWAWGVAAVVILAGAAGAVFFRQPALTVPPPPAPVVAPKPAAAPVPRVADKSIAVLPFTNMSEDKDNAFFTDGVHEDILTNLALIRELRVVSRTTVQSYRGTAKPMKQIAQELGVTYILEGSVRRVGNKVRVTGQLIHAATDEHVWAQTYDRDLTDIFAIQTELSQQIAGALKAALSPEEKIFIARKPTTNAAAYDLYLQGRDTRNRAPTASRAALVQAEELFQGAVNLDPNFAAAWGELAVVHALKTFWDIDSSAERKAKGDAAIAQARRLAPDAPEVIRLVGTHAYYAYRDYAKATAQYQRIIDLQPNDPTSYGSLGLIQRRQGRWTDAITSLRRATELDPGNITYLRNYLSTLVYVRHWPEAAEAQSRLLALLPDRLTEQFAAVAGEWRATGSLAAYEALFARLTPAQREEPVALYYRKQVALARDDYAAFMQLQARQPVYEELEFPFFSMVAEAQVHWAHGRADAARATAEQLRRETTALLAREPGNLRVRLALSSAEAILGRREEAFRLLREVTDELPVSRDAIDGSSCLLWLVTTPALLGDNETALTEAAKLLRIPSQFTVHLLRADPTLAKLRGDPRFAALLNDPKNNAPLF